MVSVLDTCKGKLVVVTNGVDDPLPLRTVARPTTTAKSKIGESRFYFGYAMIFFVTYRNRPERCSSWACSFGSCRCFFLPFSPALLHGLPNLPSRCGREMSFPAIGLTSRRSNIAAPASLKGCNGTVETVSFRFQFSDDSCCVHFGGVFSLLYRF
jgi:hypothetical protein